MGIEFGRISGPLLANNLVRKNSGLGEENLAFENNLLYLDVINGRIGISTDTPNRTFQINGTVGTVNAIIPTQFSSPNFVINTNVIQNVADKIYIQPNQSTDPKILTSKIGTVNLRISDQLIENITNNSNINFSPAGTGTVIVNSSKLAVDGNLYATGNITANGSIVFGNNDSDNVTFDADINSKIVPDLNETYDLGTALQRWNKLYSSTVTADDIAIDNITVNNINLILTHGNTYYVSTNGNDLYIGNQLHNTFRTVKHALSVATVGDTIEIFPGVYEEIFPLTVPAGVSINGMGLRAVKIVPTAGTNTNNAFLLNGETTVSNLTVADFYSGYAFSFAPNFLVTTRSPYIQDISVITTSDGPSQITVGPGTTGYSPTSNSVTLYKADYSQALVDSLVGQTAVINRYPNSPLIYTVVSIVTDPLSPTEWRMTVDTTFNPAGQFKSISFYADAAAIKIVTNDIWDTTGNSVGEKWVAWFKTNLPGSFNTTVQPGWSINVAGTIYIVDYVVEDPINTNMWRIYVTTSLVAGVGIPIFSSPIQAGNGALVDGSLANSASKEATLLVHSITMIVPGAIGIKATNGARVEWLNSFTYFAETGIYLTQGTLGFASLGVRFGAELRSIGSANVYGTYGAVADGANTLGYLISHNFSYIGSETDVSNDPRLSIQANEILEINNGKLYHESVNHTGDFRVGDIFLVNQETGTVTFDAQSINFLANGNIALEGLTSSSYIDAKKIQVGNIKIYNNNIDSLQGPVNFLAFSGNTYLNTNVVVTGNTTVSADINVDGNIIIGDQPTDTITIFPNLTQDLLPDNVGGPYTLGTSTKRWNTIYTPVLNVDDQLRITNNTVSALALNANLEIDSLGSGIVNVINTDVQVDNNLRVTNDITVLGTTNFKNTELLDIGITGDYNQTIGNTQITGLFANNNISITGASYFEIPYVKLFNNEISITSTNDNLYLVGADAGGVRLENLKFSSNELSNVKSSPLNDTEKSIKFAPNGTGLVTINSNKSLKLPVGNQSTRTLSANGEIRYNTDFNIVEGYVGTGRISFNDISDQDRNTYVRAGATNNTLSFGVNNAVRATITSTALTSSLYNIDNISLASNNITNTVSGNNLKFSPNGSGVTNLNNIGISNSVINNYTNGALTIDTIGTGYVSFSNTSAVYIPRGSNAERRAMPEIGETRFNTEKDYMEIYSGNPSLGENGWISSVSGDIVDANVVLGLLDFWTLVLG
jgi:predicted phosphodiesterase